MTIKVEREALLRVLSREPSSPTSSSSSSWPFISTCKDDDEFVIVELPTKPHEFFYDDLIPGSTDDAQREEQQRRQKLVHQDDNDDDVASLCTVSTDSISSYSNDTVSSDNDRRVSFAIDLVTDVWTREKTLLEDIPRLYYSSLETQTFRQEYRLERKVLNELSIDLEKFPAVDVEELSNLVATSSSSSPLGNGRHSISRVVVLHNDRLETFFNNITVLSSSSTDVAAAATETVLPSVKVDHPSSTIITNDEEESSNFFDNDSFWSGSLTWY